MKLRLTAWGWYVGLVWSLVYVFYFGANLFRAVTATSPKPLAWFPGKRMKQPAAGSRI